MKRYLGSAVCTTWLLTFAIGVQSQCQFPDKNTPAEDLEAYKRLKPLIGKTYTAEPPHHKYKYVVGICKSVDGTEGDGIIQISPEEKAEDQEKVLIGKYTQSSIMAGTNWILLQYEGGDSYTSHCSRENRRAIILFTCDPSATDDKPGMKLLEEENGKNSDCYYLFELAHPEICAIPASAAASLSVGSIVKMET